MLRKWAKAMTGHFKLFRPWHPLSHGAPLYLF